MTNTRVRTALPDTQTISFTREFEAPAERVFGAHVDADLVAQWIGPRGTQLRMREFDARTGGSWSYVVTGLGGEWAFHGSFHEVTAPTRLVQTSEFDGDPGHPSLEVFEFVDLPDGRSRIDGLSVFLSIADRDAVVGDLDDGRDEDYNRLDDVLAGTQQPVAAG
jgi:uncharacterized protein YndB with AHSA1/START domain